MENIYEENWFKALNLEERISLLKKYPTTNIDVAKDTGTSEKLWREIPCLVEKEAFNALFQNRNLSDKEFKKLLSIPPSELSKHIDTIPGWAINGFKLDRNNSAMPETTSSQTIDNSYSNFLQPVNHIINKGERNLKRELEKIGEKNKHILVDNELVLEAFRHDIHERLTEIIIKPMVTEMHIAGLLSALSDNNSSSRFDEFLKKFSDPDVVINFINLYPVAIRLSSVATQQFQAVILETINRLYCDYESLNQAFGRSKGIGVLKEIKFGLGDPHKNGRTVSQLEFDSGLKIIYKPRSLEIDVHFQSILSHISNELDDLPFRFPKILNRGDYGYMEYIEQQPCKSQDEISRFFYRHGFQLAVLYLMGGTDFHHENIIACGENPILVDLETLMTPKYKPASIHADDNIADSFIMDSVLGTGLLPFKIQLDPKLEPVDISGLSNGDSQIAPILVPIWRDVGTDTMHLKRELMPIAKASNHPVSDNDKINLIEYLSEIIDGFSNAFKLLENHKYAIKLLILNTKDAITRVVARPTYEYAFILRESYHPYHLGDALDRDRYFDQLWYRIKFQPELKEIFNKEIKDLWQGDIPFFTTRPNSKSLWSSYGEEITDFYSNTGITDALRRLDKLDEGNLIYQIWLIRLSIVSSTLAQGIPVKKQGFQLSADSDILSHSIEIGDYLVKQVIESEERASWISLSETEFRIHTPVIAGTDLYAGLPGIILFLTYLSEISGQQKYNKVAKAGLNSLKHSLENLDGQGLTCGAFDGLGGIIYTLTHLSVLLDDKSLVKLSEKYIYKAEELLKSTPGLDIVSGAAGCILALLADFSVSGSELSLSIAKRYGDYLLRQKNEDNQGFTWLPDSINELTETGFGHGAMGIVYALHQLYLTSKIHKYKLPAEFVLTVIKDSVDDKNNAPVEDGGINNSWCRGLSGCYGSFLRIYSNVSENLIASFLQKADFSESDCSCHGEMGNLDAVIGTKLFFSNEKIRDLVYNRFQRLMIRVNDKGWFCGTPVESIGFMEGMAGIGYQLLRMAHPSRVPSILFLEVPEDKKSSEKVVPNGSTALKCK